MNSSSASTHLNDLKRLYNVKLRAHRQLMKVLLDDLQSNSDLQPYVHSFRNRIKSKNRFRDKINEKRGKGVEINTDNVFDEITDIAGIRILCLFYRSMVNINSVLVNGIHFGRLIEGPIVFCNDPIQSRYLEKISNVIQRGENGYASVHYVFESTDNPEIKCEIQVRTIYEEAWAEISHIYSYQKKNLSVAVQNHVTTLIRLCTAAGVVANSIEETENENKSLRENAESLERQTEQLQELVDDLKKELKKKQQTTRTGTLMDSLRTTATELSSSIIARPQITGSTIITCYICEEAGLQLYNSAYSAYSLSICSVCNRWVCPTHQSQSTYRDTWVVAAQNLDVDALATQEVICNNCYMPRIITANQ